MIKKKRVYRTRQRDVIEACVASFGEEHFTAAQIVSELSDRGTGIGQATVYRTIENLVSSGLVRKYVVDESSAACYQYTGKADNGVCHDHFHLKCQSCGRLIHVECEQLGKIAEHMSKDHGFVIDSSKTVFYGKCEDCGK